AVRNYSGSTTYTVRHKVHVHISVYGNAARLPGTGDWVLPLPNRSYQLTARFDQCGDQWVECHTGLDFAASEGTPVSAGAQGRVVFAGGDGAYGNSTRHDHGPGVVPAP